MTRQHSTKDSVRFLSTIPLRNYLLLPLETRGGRQIQSTVYSYFQAKIYLVSAHPVGPTARFASRTDTVSVAIRRFHHFPVGREVGRFRTPALVWFKIGKSRQTERYVR